MRQILLPSFIKLLSGLLLALTLAAVPSYVDAATYIVSPSSKQLEVGEELTVSVLVSSPDQAVNAVSGRLFYSADLFEPVGISKSGSIVQIWVAEPVIDRGTATIHFEGVLLNPGFQGGGAMVVSFTLRALAPGAGSISFLSGSVLANDGQGTNVLQGVGAGNYQVTSTPPVQEQFDSDLPPEAEKEQSVVVSLPNAPSITSSTHPKQDLWYPKDQVRLSWELEEDVTAVSYILDSQPTTIPPATAQKRVDSFFRSVSDGIWYFHLRVQKDGLWSNTAHYRFRVDLTGPENLQAEVLQPLDLTLPSRTLLISANDALSGIAGYEIYLPDGQLFESWVYTPETTQYQTDFLEPGEYQLTLRAYDFVGNTSEIDVSFLVEPLSPPAIIEYTPTLDTQTPFSLLAKTSAEAAVYIWIEQAGEAVVWKIESSDEEGVMRFISEDPLDLGEYHIWLVAQDDRGATSIPSRKIKVSVTSSPSSTWFFGHSRFFTVFVTLALMFLFVIGGIFLMRIILDKRRSRDVLDPSILEVKNKFKSIRDQLISTSTYAARKGDQSAELAMKELKQKIDDAEKVLIKELQDLETINPLQKAKKTSSKKKNNQ